MNKLIVVFSLICIFTSCGRVDNVQTDKAKIVMDGTTYWIPKKYILNDFPESLVPKNPNMDKGFGINIGIPLEGLGFAVDPNKYPYPHKLIVLMSPYSDITIKSEIHPLAINAWLGEGRFKERLIEFDEVANAYRIYVKTDYPSSWQYFKVSPEFDHRVKNISEIWLASCSYSPWEKLKLDYSNLDCSVSTRHKTIFSHINFSGDRIKDLDKLLKNYEDLLRQWEEQSN